MRKKSLLIICLLLSFSFSSYASVTAHAFNSPFSNEWKVQLAEEGFKSLYNSIDYGKARKPAYDVFRKSFVGYLNLLQQGKLRNSSIITLIDFSLPSVQKRMWVIDLRQKKVLFYDLVAHGKNSGGNMASSFSNISNSHKSSLGFYVTANKYYGKHGLSLRLQGQEAGFNDMAMKRAIVMHGANYVNKDIIKSLGRLGRSFGCPAVSMDIYKDVIETVAEGSCLFIYYPQNDYLQKSLLLNELVAADFFLSREFQAHLI